MKECPYPDLFSSRTLECDEFTRVTCGKVPEPQAPCKCYDYIQTCHLYLYMISVLTNFCREVEKTFSAIFKNRFS